MADSLAVDDVPPGMLASPTADTLDFDEFEEELRRLSAANAELLQQFRGDSPETPGETTEPPASDVVQRLEADNADLRARVQELEALAAGKGEELWQEQQREYETLLEEKSEVIRSLHQKLQEREESAVPVEGDAISPSGTRVAQAEEIQRLKRELAEQRQQLERDEEEMMAQMREMELTMAKERAEMARQRQEIQRLQSDLARELENSARAPELRERLQTLRPARQTPPPATLTPRPADKDQKSTGFFRRMFG